MITNTDPGSGTIVVGVDGTAGSAASVRWAVQEARLRRVSVHIVCTDDPSRRSRAPYSARPVAPWPDESNAVGTALLSAEQQASQALPPGRLSSELADGSPAQVLIHRSAGADLLVLGRAYPAGQPNSQAPPSMGPVAGACLHGAACPVVFADPAYGNLVSTANAHRHLVNVPRGRPRAE
jgi:nucleotide-binding universal stress UspA family protein